MGTTAGRTAEYERAGRAVRIKLPIVERRPRRRDDAVLRALRRNNVRHDQVQARPGDANLAPGLVPGLAVVAVNAVLRIGFGRHDQVTAFADFGAVGRADFPGAAAV